MFVLQYFTEDQKNHYIQHNLIIQMPFLFGLKIKILHQHTIRTQPNADGDVSMSKSGSKLVSFSAHAMQTYGTMGPKKVSK